MMTLSDPNATTLSKLILKGLNQAPLLQPHQVEKSANSNARHGYSTNQKRESNPRHLMNLVWAVALMDIILTSKVQFQEVELERTLRRLKEAFPTLANKRRDARQQKK
ncbi:hypothetical protein Bca4012_056625 [Brassica carinata]